MYIQTLSQIYKNLASIAQLFSDSTSVKKTVLLEDSLVESMVKQPVEKVEKMEPIDNLVYKTFATKLMSNIPRSFQTSSEMF